MNQHYSAQGSGPETTSPQQKSGWKKWLIIGCTACFGLMSMCCATGAYLLYLEEGRSHYSDMGDAVIEIDVTAGVPFTATFEWGGGGYASHDLWLKPTGMVTSSSLDVSGSFSCGRGGYAGYPGGYEQTFRSAYSKDGDYFHLGSEYLSSSDRTTICTGTINSEMSGFQTGKLAITRFQRPSDWF